MKSRKINEEINSFSNPQNKGLFTFYRQTQQKQKNIRNHEKLIMNTQISPIKKIQQLTPKATSENESIKIPKRVCSVIINPNEHNFQKRSKSCLYNDNIHQKLELKQWNYSEQFNLNPSFKMANQSKQMLTIKKLIQSKQRVRQSCKELEHLEDFIRHKEQDDAIIRYKANCVMNNILKAQKRYSKNVILKRMRLNQGLQQTSAKPSLNHKNYLKIQQNQRKKTTVSKRLSNLHIIERSPIGQQQNASSYFPMIEKNKIKIVNKSMQSIIDTAIKPRNRRKNRSKSQDSISYFNKSQQQLLVKKSSLDNIRPMQLRYRKYSLLLEQKDSDFEQYMTDLFCRRHTQLKNPAPISNQREMKRNQIKIKDDEKPKGLMETIQKMKDRYGKK